MASHGTQILARDARGISQSTTFLLLYERMMSHKASQQLLESCILSIQVIKRRGKQLQTCISAFHLHAEEGLPSSSGSLVTQSSMIFSAS